MHITDTDRLDFLQSQGLMECVGYKTSNGAVTVPILPGQDIREVLDVVLRFFRETTKTTVSPFRENLILGSEEKVGAFESELTTLINKYSREEHSNTPDFVLAKYLHDCFKAFDMALQSREAWYGRPIYAPSSVPSK
jgi:hypothetical protein